MTAFMAAVVTAHEAALACEGGVDAVDFAAPAPSGTLDLARLAAVCAEVAGRCETGATISGGRLAAADIAGLATAAADAGAGVLRIELRDGGEALARAAAVAPLAARVRLIGGLYADCDFEAVDLRALAAHGFSGVMLDMAKPGRLLSRLDLTALGRFAEACATAKLAVGFAGGLEAPDVERLLLLAPERLGFRAALTRNGAFSPSRIEMIRALIPRDRLAESDTSAARIAVSRVEPADRVFVHDLVLPVAIGAYDRERGVTQQVRFNVDADVRRATQAAHDMRDVFSYDLITDAIRLILDRGHVVFVETLAEEIAQAVLSHARVLKVRVRVEKLELGAGGVGVEIFRDRASAGATVHRLFPEPATGGHQA